MMLLRESSISLPMIWLLMFGCLKAKAVVRLLNLHPMELGRMSITVATEGSETKVMFVVETAQARQSAQRQCLDFVRCSTKFGLSLTDSDVAERKDQPQSGDSETRLRTDQ